MGKLAQQLGGQSQVKVFKTGGLIKNKTAKPDNCKPASAMKCGGAVKGKK